MVCSMRALVGWPYHTWRLCCALLPAPARPGARCCTGELAHPLPPRPLPLPPRSLAAFLQALLPAVGLK